MAFDKVKLNETTKKSSSTVAAPLRNTVNLPSLSNKRVPTFPKPILEVPVIDLSSDSSDEDNCKENDNPVASEPKLPDSKLDQVTPSVTCPLDNENDCSFDLFSDSIVSPPCDNDHEPTSSSNEPQLKTPLRKVIGNSLAEPDSPVFMSLMERINKAKQASTT